MAATTTLHAAKNSHPASNRHESFIGVDFLSGRREVNGNR
jgi:hypothetical protein